MRTHHATMRKDNKLNDGRMAVVFKNIVTERKKDTTTQMLELAMQGYELAIKLHSRPVRRAV